MRTRPAAPAAVLAVPLLAALLLTGCVAAENDAERATRCRDLATGISQAGLGGSPTREQARQAALRLDSQLLQLRDPGSHDAAVSLHFHLHVLDAALGRGEQAKAARALADSRADVGNLAKACGLPPADFGLR